ncbi:tektin-4-like [Chelonus insularis]|uniref:tektin-4-like n=1 Tax=Chelonus insularis TaxID=460826 RepID=UPI00158E626D|nr:tektin-4-like [Chelonus insularis]
MLQRQFLDERCTLNDPGRIRDERCCIGDLPTAESEMKSRRIEPCHQLNYKNGTVLGDDCPTVNVLRERIGNDEKPPYFPQPEDNIPPKAEGPMGPIGPWATGRPVFSPTTGMTGIRPVVDRYSMTRYTPAQWRIHNQTFFDQSTKIINNARTITKNFRQSNNKIYKETDKNQLENRDKLSIRASEIHHFKAQLEQAILELTDEIELLEGELCRVKQSLSILIIPENISGEFLQLRSLRMEPDLVRDKVEDELVKEIALLAEVRALLTQKRQSIEDQLVELKTAKARAEFDITDKIDAYTIESECVGLTNDSPLIMMKPGATRVSSEQSCPEEYKKFTKENLEYCENVRQKSIALRLNLDATYLKAVKDLRSQAIQVDAVLAEKVDMTEQICQELEKELVNCLNELTDIEQLIEELRGASKGLNDAMKVAQSRLDYRLQRKNIESCRDVPQYRLIDEVKTIQENLTAMAGQLKSAEETQADLVKSRGDLEREIMVKKKSLYIDRDRGQLLRSYYPSAEALSGHV